MLECKAGDLDACCKMCGASDLGAVDTIKDFTKVGGESDEDFRTFAAHGHEADGRFGVGSGFGGEDEIDGVGLGFPS